MKFFEASKYHFFKKSTYINLRWIGIIGQLISVNFVYFFLNFNFDFVTSNLIISLGILSNLFLILIYRKTQLSDRSAFIFLVIDILQLSILLYLTGGVTNPFVIFLLIPSIFSSSNLSFKTNFLLPRKNLNGKINNVPTLWKSYNKNNNLLDLLDVSSFQNQDMSISLWQLNNYLDANNLSNKKLIKNLNA